MVKRVRVYLWVFALPVLAVLYTLSCRAQETGEPTFVTEIALPAPDLTHATTLEQALLQRRSVRRYAEAPLSLAEVSNLLWAAQGITDPPSGKRTAPSAMAVYPLQVYLVAANVTDLPAGVYRYVPLGHKLILVMEGDQRKQVGTQPQMTTAPALLVYTTDNAKLAQRVGEARASQWAALEAGHSAQNVLLEEVALDLVGVPMAAFDPAKTRAALKLPAAEEPIYVLSAAKRP